MSLILDALNRAERERKKTQDVPDLQTVHEPLSSVAEPSSGRNPVVVLMGIVVAGLIVAIIYMLFRTPDSEPSISPSVIAPVDDTVSGVDGVSPEPRAQAPALAETLDPQPEVPLAEAQNNRPARNDIADPAARSDLDDLYSSARAEAAPKDPVDSLYVTPEPESLAVPQRETVIPLPPVAVRNYESLVAIPDIGDLPWGFRKEIPSINYVRHNFGGEEADSLILHGRAYYAGSALSPDLVLEEIYVDGAVFQFKQVKFKLRALNSWVNM